MSKLTKEEISWYLKYNCTLETSPRCSECHTQNDDIYTDELYGEMFCKECLVDSLNNDEVALKELRIENLYENRNTKRK
jgi:recombinational DNA repair protein (RecF pathway)